MNTRGLKGKRLFIIIIIAIMAPVLMAGCGKSNNMPASAYGSGSVSAAIKFKGIPDLQRSASLATSSIIVTIEIKGVYDKDNVEFASVTAVVDLSKTDYVELSVPTGVNHLLSASASYPGVGTETIRCIIPQVRSGEKTQVSVNRRSTLIADATAYLARRGEKKLSQIDRNTIDLLARIVDYIAVYENYYSVSLSEVISYYDAADTAVLVTLSPATASVQAGETRQFTAVIKNNIGDTITKSVSWTAGSDIGTINSTGLFTASTSLGSGTVTATVDGVSCSASVTVTENLALKVVSVTVAPASTSVQIGETTQFTATIINALGNPITKTITWTATSSLGTISSTGLFTPASTLGSGTVTAAVDGITGSANISVTENLSLRVVSVTIAPTSSTVLVGETAQFTATIINALGNPITKTITWTASSSIGTVSSTGLFTATRAGSGDVTAAVDGFTATSSITVNEIVTGIVTSNSTPVEGAVVRLYNETYSNTIQTDANGSYTFNNVPAGTYFIVATKDNFTLESKTITIPQT